MLENLYADIGAKIKTWAVWIFIVESIGAIITGVILMGSELLAPGFLVMIIGPIAAWVSSWLLYAFGQLVEDIHELRNIEYAQLQTQEKPQTKIFDAQPAKTSAAPAVSTPASKEKDPNKNNAPISAEIKDGNKVCPQCGTEQKADRRICWSCGQHFDN